MREAELVDACILGQERVELFLNWSAGTSVIRTEQVRN